MSAAGGILAAALALLIGAASAAGAGSAAGPAATAGRSPGPGGLFTGHDPRVPLRWLHRPAAFGPGDYGRRLTVGGRERYYELHVPPTYAPGTAMPLVLVLHGGGGFPAEVRYATRMAEVADERGFLALFPAGTSPRFTDRKLHWHAGPMPKDASREAVDDVAFMGAVLDDVARFFTVDPRRIHATGISNGAQMSARLGSRLYPRLASVAFVAGGFAPGVYDPPPPGPLPVLQFHGTDDPYLPFGGGVSPPISPFDYGRPLDAAPAIARAWARHNGCAAEPTVTRQGVATIEAFGPAEREVVFWRLAGGGHTWPGGRPSELLEKGRLGPLAFTPVGATIAEIDAARLMADFFARHPRRP